MKRLNYILLPCFIFLLSGCVVRTYQATRDRVDQDLTSGNRGYLMGTAPGGAEKERATTRTTRVVEVELRSPLKFEKVNKPAVSEQAQEPAMEENVSGNKGYITESVPTEEKISTEKYTVQKGDTLQKISQKFYGTTKNWYKLYKTNQDVLKSPNKLRPGQTITIPEIPGAKPEGLKEPKENLK